MDLEILFHENLGLIDGVTAHVCRKARLSRDEAEDFASYVRLALMEDGYARLRRWEGRSSLTGFLCVVIRRLLATRYDRELGRWRPSAEATRLGETGVLLERLLVRDGRALEEILPILLAHDPSLTRQAVLEMAARLRGRTGRRRHVALDETDERLLAGSTRADELALSNEVRRLSRRASAIVRRTMARWTDRDVLLIRFRFGASMTIAEISRKLDLPQRPLYRRIEALLRMLRDALVGAGLDAATLSGVIGESWQEMDFGLGV